jgi:4-amino-4-deoxy-L-arabinose transferase-like glycosyltransferase
MTIRLSLRFISIVVLGLLAATGIFLVLHATPGGLSLTDDSIGYIAGARSMLAGQGYREAWLASNGPVTHFPPALSSVLAFIGLFGLDPLRGVRFLNAILFGLNIVLVGILGWRMTRWLVPGLVLAALFLATDSLLRVHATALSEPLFIFLSLLAFWVFDLYIERDAYWLWLVSCGVLVGLAYLTRYAALALVATFVIALLILHGNWRKRLIAVGIFLASVLPWVIGWAIRNQLVGGTATNRDLVWHPVTADNLDMGLRTASSFLVPVETWRTALIKVPFLFLILIALVLGAVLVWVVLRARDYARAGKDGRPRGIVAFSNGLYLFGYLGAVIASMSLFDASTKFRLRILAPACVALLVLLMVLGVWLWSRRREAAIVLGLIVFGMSAYGQFGAVTELAKGPQGYASFKWYDSKAIAFLRRLPPDVMIYTNEPGAVYLYTDRGVYVLPDRYDPVTAEPRPGFEQGIMEMQSQIKEGKAALALFSGGQPSAEDAALLSNGLYLADKSAGDEVFTAAP